MFRQMLHKRRFFEEERGDSFRVTSSAHVPEELAFCSDEINDEEDMEEIEVMFEQERRFWNDKMNHARSLEELEALKAAWEALSIALLDKARKQGLLFARCVQDFVVSCAHTYEERKKEVPAKTAVAKRLVWPSVGLFFAAFVVVLIVAPPFAPLVLDTMDLLLGATMVGYTLFDSYNKKRVAQEHFNKDYPLPIKVEEGVKLFNSSLGFGLAVIGAVALTGVFPPLGILIIAAIALVPVAIEIGIRYKAYRDTKEAIETAKTEGAKKEAEFLANINEKIMNQEISRHSRQSLVEAVVPNKSVTHSTLPTDAQNVGKWRKAVVVEYNSSGKKHAHHSEMPDAFDQAKPAQKRFEQVVIEDHVSIGRNSGH